MSLELKAALEELRKAHGMQNSAWMQVIEAGRAYAEMKAHGTKIVDGRCVLVSFRDQQQYTEHFTEELLRAVQQAYAEDARMGATISTLTKS